MRIGKGLREMKTAIEIFFGGWALLILGVVGIFCRRYYNSVRKDVGCE